MNKEVKNEVVQPSEIIDAFQMPEPPALNWKFDELKTALIENLKPYSGIMVTEDNLSDCKAKQKEIAGYRKRIDEFRKDVKKKYQEPLKVFETQCKELIGIINDAEAPLNKDIKVFDDKRRAAKRETAEAIIREYQEEYQLGPLFAGKIEMKSKYLNLTASEKDVRADVEAQCILLKQQQDEREQMFRTIQIAVDNANKDITAKLSVDAYTSLIDTLPVDQIIGRIMKRASEVREAEQKKAEQEKPELSPEPPVQKPEPVAQPAQGEAVYRCTFVITGSAEQQKAVSGFLKANNIAYKVENQYVLRQEER